MLTQSFWRGERPNTSGSGGVVLCTYGLCPGGAERQWVYLAAGLQRLGVKVTFVTHDPLVGASAHYLPALKNERVPLIEACELTPWEDSRLRSDLNCLSGQLGFEPGDVDRILQLVTAFRKVKPQAVYAQLDTTNILAGIAARVAGINRFIMSFRNYNPTHFPWMYGDWLLPSYKWLAAWNRVRYTGNSATGNASYAEWLGLAPEEITLIPNMLGRSNRSPPRAGELERVRKEFGLRPEDKVVLGVFRLHPEKDPRTFVHVAREVLNHVPESKFILAGDGPLRQELLLLAGELRLGDRIAFIGHRHDVPALMGIAKVLLHTSKREGMSNVVMEAQSLGLPVVGPAIPGISQTVDVGNSAFLCEPGNVTGFSEALKKILLNHDVWQRLAQGSTLFAAGRFDEQAVCESYLRIALET